MPSGGGAGPQLLWVRAHSCGPHALRQRSPRCLSAQRACVCCPCSLLCLACKGLILPTEPRPPPRPALPQRVPHAGGWPADGACRPPRLTGAQLVTPGSSAACCCSPRPCRSVSDARVCRCGLQGAPFVWLGAALLSVRSVLTPARVLWCAARSLCCPSQRLQDEGAAPLHRRALPCCVGAAAAELRRGSGAAPPPALSTNGAALSAAHQELI